MSDDTPPAGGRPAFRAGQAFQQLIETDPEARAAWERFRRSIVEGIESVRDELSGDPVGPDWWDELPISRYLDRPKNIEDWEHLARIIEFPYDRIANGYYTWDDVYLYALAWVDRQEIMAKLTADKALGEGEGKPPTTRKRMKEPSANAFAAYRAVKLAGLKQEDVGHRLGVGQSTISRWIDKVVEWLEAGNILPDELAAQPPRPKPITMDPRKLEQGPRRRGRA